MRGLLAALFAVTAMAQVPIPGPSSGTGSSVSLPPFAAASNAGTDVICALHADVITGLTCNNQVVDGSTETAFVTTTTVPANVLASSVTSVNLNLGVLATATIPSITIKIKLGSTVIYQGGAQVSVAGSRALALNCLISAPSAAGASAPLITTCSTGGLPSATNVAANALITNSNLSVAANTSVSNILSVTVTFSANTTQNAIWLYSISSTPAGSTASAGGLLIAQTTLSAAQINAMFTSPVLLVLAQGAGTIINVSKCVWNAVFGSAAFTGGGPIDVFFSATSPPVSPASAGQAATLLTSFSANQFAAGTNAVAVTTGAVNQGLYVSNQTGVFAGGTGSSMTVSCLYTVLTGMQ